MTQRKPRYEDIHSDFPYLKGWESGEVAYIDILYVPPDFRRQGKGTQLVNDWLLQLSGDVKRVKLKAVTLGGYDAVNFWCKLGFVNAYTGFLYHEIQDTMTIGVNGYENPAPEFISEADIDRHWLEGPEDLIHFSRHPQVLAHE